MSDRISRSKQLPDQSIQRNCWQFTWFAVLAAALAVGVGSAWAVPTVTIAVPTANATVSGQVSVRGDVSAGVTSVELYEGGLLKASGPPASDKTYSLTWNSAGAALGAHTLVVKAYDGSGNTSKSNTVYIRALFNVRNYGAQGNGVTDDSSAIQSTLTAAKGAGGGTVYFPPGTYIINPFAQVYYVGSNIEFRGDGPSVSVIKVKNNSGDYAFIFGQTGSAVISNLSFRHLRFDQNPTGNPTATMTAQEVIQLYSVNNIEVDDVSFDPEPGVQAVLVAGTGSTGVTVDGSTFHFVRDPLGPAYYDNSSVYTEAANVLVRKNNFTTDISQDAIAAVEVHGGPTVEVEKNTVTNFTTAMNIVNSSTGFPNVPKIFCNVHDNQFSGMSLALILWSVTSRTLSDVTITNNTIAMAQHLLYANTWSGLDFYYLAGDQGTKGNFANITFTNNTVDFTPLLSAGINSQYAYGVNVAPKGKVTGMTATGNQILSSPIVGLHIGNPAESTNTTTTLNFTGNTIVDAGWDTTVDPLTNTRAAVILDQAKMTTVNVKSNTIQDTGPPGAPKGDYSLLGVPKSTSTGVAFQLNTITPIGVLNHYNNGYVNDAGQVY